MIDSIIQRKNWWQGREHREGHDYDTKLWGSRCQ